MPRLPRFSSWDILSRAYLPKDIRPPRSRTMRLGRPLPRIRFKIGSRSFAIRPIVPIAIALAALHAAVHYGYVFPSGSPIDPALRSAIELGSTLLILSVCLIASFRYVDPTLVAFSRIRTAEVQRAIAMHRRGTLDAANSVQLSELLAARSREAASKSTDGMASPGAIQVILHTQSHRLVFILAVFLPALIGDYRKQLQGLDAPVMLAPMAALVTLYFIGARLPHRLTSTAANRRCIDCNYPFAELPSPFDGAPGPPIPSGPERCPECGAPWPLVPPRLY